MTRTPPREPEAEAAVLGAMLLTQRAREDMANVLTAADFHDRRNAAIFSVLVDLAAEGRPADPLVLLDRLRAHNVTAEHLTALHMAAPSTYNAAEYAVLVERAAVARRAILVLDGALSAAWDGDPATALGLLDDAHDVLAAPFDDVDAPIDAADLAAEDHEVDWLVHGLLARHEEVLIVAEPGSGKSLWLNQFGVLVASGLHPWTRVPIPRRRVLIFDFQDSRGARGRQVQWLLRLAGDRYERGHLFYEMRSQGVDLTQRADQRWFEAKVAKTNPDIIILGPLYNAVQGGPQRSKQSEETAQLAGRFLSELIVRRGCALMVEAHAPHGEELRVRGSKYWEDWAGWGLGLRASVEDGRRTFKLERFRGDREADRQWPSRWVQGWPDHWPWDVPPDSLPKDPTGGSEPLPTTASADDIPIPTQGSMT